MWRFLRTLVDPVVTILLSPWIISRLLKPSDRERAETFRIIAEALAAQLIREYPSSDIAQLIALLIERLSAAIPPQYRTSNLDVLTRVAEAALLKVKRNG